MSNSDAKTIRDFGREWKHFDQSALSEAEVVEHFERYFRIFPWSRLPPGAVGFDLGCGSGRWARLVATRVGDLHCIDASADALEVAKRTLGGRSNCRFHHASVDSIPLPEGSMDFGYSLGVLHHVPDTLAGLRACTSRLREGAPFLLYLYYAMDNRPAWFRVLWRLSDVLRRLIAPLPHALKVALTLPIALFVYWPLSRLAAALEWAGMSSRAVPLSYYRRASLYTLRTDALDRFGTRLEKRFTRKEIETLMRSAGLGDIVFNEAEPFWTAVGFKTAAS